MAAQDPPFAAAYGESERYACAPSGLHSDCEGEAITPSDRMPLLPPPACSPELLQLQSQQYSDSFSVPPPFPTISPTRRTPTNAVHNAPPSTAMATLANVTRTVKETVQQYFRPLWSLKRKRGKTSVERPYETRSDPTEPGLNSPRPREPNPFTWDITYAPCSEPGVVTNVRAVISSRIGVAMLDPCTPFNLLSRRFAEKLYLNLDLLQARQSFQTIDGHDAVAIGTVKARWWLNSHKSMDPMFVESEFYIMDSGISEERFDIIIGCEDILKHNLLTANRPLVAAHFRSPQRSMDQRQVLLQQQAADARRRRAHAERVKEQNIKRAKSHAEGQAYREARAYAADKAGAYAGEVFDAIVKSQKYKEVYWQAFHNSYQSHLAWLQECQSNA